MANTPGLWPPGDHGLTGRLQAEMSDGVEDSIPPRTYEILHF